MPEFVDASIRPDEPFVITELPGLHLKEPINVEITQDEEDGLFKAHATELGMLEDGFGETAEAAVSDLQSTIIRQYQWLTDSTVKTEDYAQTVKERLMNVIEKLPA